MARIRFHVQTRDVPPSIAARALGLTLDKFSEHLPALVKRGFPQHDPTTGNYDLKAIERWQDLRHKDLLAGNSGDNVSIVPSEPSGADITRERLKAQTR